MSRIIYISPHLDDVALSCGGLVWEQAQTGNRVEIWTICAGDPPSQGISPFAKELHQKWGVGEDSYKVRRQEDIRSCEILGVEYAHWGIQDCVYRLDPMTGKPLYDSEESLRGSLSDLEEPIMNQVASRLNSEINSTDILICPLAIGGHVDHLLTRRSVEAINFQLVYYQDFPYIVEYGFGDTKIPEGHKARKYQVSNAGLEAWVEAVTAHQSQISTFWDSPEELRIAITKYYSDSDGISLWENN